MNTMLLLSDALISVRVKLMIHTMGEPGYSAWCNEQSARYLEELGSAFGSPLMIRILLGSVTNMALQLECANS